MKMVYIVTHGEAEDKPNPSLTIKGKQQMTKLKGFLEGKKFDLIISGAGKRHKEAYNIIVGQERRPDIESEPIGVPETLSADKKELIFPDGRRIPVKEYTRTRYQELQKGLVSLLNDVFEKAGENALIIGGRIAVIPLGVENLISGAVYVFNEERNLVSIIQSNNQNAPISTKELSKTNEDNSVFFYLNLYQTGSNIVHDPEQASTWFLRPSRIKSRQKLIFLIELKYE